jgi:serine phosphatase RsbU (regulator of sigma subunit)
VAVFDAMGHGLRSSTLGSLAVSSYRNTRRGRHPADLRTLLTDVDAVIADYAGGDAFVTATFVQLDITTGRVQWVSAGHPPPLHVRRTCLPPVDARPAPPLGLGSWREPDAFDVVEMSLEPGDGLLLYTDGVLDARDADGHEFGEARLRHLLERESASGEEPAELLRRVIHSVLNHHPGRLRDDASTLYLRWDAAAPHRR